VSRPCQRGLNRLFPRCTDQRGFTACLVLGHGVRGHYLVSVSSTSGEVACMCMPSAG
jgi:hypothetical protein